jgi:hypothetical protein
MVTSPEAEPLLSQNNCENRPSRNSPNFAVALNCGMGSARRAFVDNSLTFGGFHYNDPRKIYGEVRYHFHF